MVGSRVVGGGALARERGQMEGRSSKLLFLLAHGVGVVVGQVTRSWGGQLASSLLFFFVSDGERKQDSGRGTDSSV